MGRCRAARCRSLTPATMRLPPVQMDRRQASASMFALPLAALPHWPASAALATEAWPLLGLGTCCEEPEEVAAQVTSAVNAGYRFIDTAAHYPGEAGVGDALAALEAGGVVRPGEVAVCSKVWFDDMGYEPALASARRSLARLRRERLDLLLVHFPGSPDARQATHHHACAAALIVSSFLSASEPASS